MCFRFAWCERLRCARVITSVNLSCWQINHIYRSEKGAKARHCWRKKFKWPDSQLLLCLEKIKCLGYRAAGILTSCREKVQQKQVLKWLYYSKLTRGNYAKLPKLKWLSQAAALSWRILLQVRHARKQSRMAFIFQKDIKFSHDQI
jgi:hypothetical protein